MRFTVFFLVIILLNGCAKSILDNDSRCPFIERGGCQSMEMVNKMVSERRFTSDGLFVQQVNRCLVKKQARRCHTC